MMGKKEKSCYVRGKWISFDREATKKKKKTYNLKEMKDGFKFKQLRKDPEYQKIVDMLTNGKGEWKATKKKPFKSIARGSLTEKAKVWFYSIASVMLLSKHLSIV